MANGNLKTFDNTTVQRAAEMLLAAAPGATVILFGSYVRGSQTPDSDLDFLVIEPQVVSQIKEMVRLRDVLRPLRISADIIVTSEEDFNHWSKIHGTVHYDAATEGRVYHAVA